MKKNSQPILSICIPTWNRWYALQYTLKSIMNQNGFKSGDVEIVISDNASTDETEHEVGKLCKKYNNIRYFRNEKNIGPNPNINKVLSLGQGEYLWLVGSDTLITNGGIKNTISCIHNYSPDIIYNNLVGLPKFKHLNTNFNKKGEIYLFTKTEDFLNHLSNQYVYDKKSFLYIEHILTFVSCICLSKGFYTDVVKSNEYNENNLFSKNCFSQDILCFFKNANNGVVLIKKNYMDRVPNQLGYKVSHKIVKDFVYFINFIENRYYMINKNFRKLKRESYIYWYKPYLLGIIFGIISKILKKVGLYNSIRYFYRKNILKNPNVGDESIEYYEF